MRRVVHFIQRAADYFDPLARLTKAVGDLVAAREANR